MKCARCRASLEDHAMVCGQCGGVVGMTYGPPRGAPKADFPSPKVTPGTFAGPGVGATRRLPDRVRSILFSPRDEWRVIAGESTSGTDVWMGYVIPMAIIGPVALAISQLDFGGPGPIAGVTTAPLVAGIAMALLTFAFALVQVAVLAWGVNAMALKFRAIPDRLAALRAVAYSMTPVWLVGIVYLLPALAFLWVFAAIYAVFLAFLGLQTLMRCSPPQALAYTFATLGIAFVMWVVTGALVTALLGFGGPLLSS